MKHRPRKKRSGGTRKGTAAPQEVPTAKSKPDVLGELVNFLKGQWLRSYILFSGLANEADRLAMVRFARFIDAIKEARTWQR